MKIVFIGAGNLATHLSAALRAGGHDIVQIYSRTMASASALAARVGAEPTDSIDSVCRDLQRTDGHIHHFLYEKNGCGTPGHIRANEAEGMARELSAFIEGLGEDIWQR